MKPETKTALHVIAGPSVAVVIVFALLFWFAGQVLHGQVSAQTKGATQLVQTTAAATPLFVAPPLPKFLVWDGPTNATGYAVYTGSSRSALTNLVLVSTNRVLFNSSLTYGIATRANGEESDLAYWPQDRVFELWLTGFSGGVTSPRTNIVKLGGPYTNNPPGQMRFWGIEDRTIRHE